MLADILSRYKTGTSLVFTVLFSLSCLIWQSSILSRSVSQAAEVLDFFTRTFHALGSGVSRLFDSYASYESLKTERDLLRDKLKENQDAALQLVRLKDENNRLRNLLQFSASPDFPILQAEVISQDPDNWFRTIIINKGSNDGIEPYMPVIAVQSSQTQDGKEKLLQGVVGKVIQVNRNSSRVLPILDQYSRLGIQVKKSGHWALLVGQNPHHDIPLLEYLSLGIFLNPGDELVTSGGDGIFPKGIPVGIVGEKIERLGGFQRAEVIPEIDFKRLDYVMVLLKKRYTTELQFPPLTPENIPLPELKPQVNIQPEIEKTETPQ
ncbi:MAG: rod shape-determining protein MreC [Leptospiraceae bacterium]|nr:rod shape-determining protein MreC [Leptospiraceae bacterium]MCB1199826.1 rod shape-determining protein MreC [Leptospiraceae bacterium]